MATVQDEIHIAKRGNSKAMRIPSKIVKELDLKDGQVMTIAVKGQSIILTPVKNQSTDSHELFAGWQDDGVRDDELDWGKAKGDELEW